MYIYIYTHTYISTYIYPCCLALSCRFICFSTLCTVDITIQAELRLTKALAANKTVKKHHKTNSNDGAL